MIIGPFRFAKQNFSAPVNRFMTLLLALLLLGCITAGAQVEAPDEHYARVYKLIEQGDAFQKAGQTNAAKLQFQQAQAELQNLRSHHPGWSSKVVNYRLNYINTQLARLSPETAQPVAVPASTAPTATSGGSTGAKATPPAKPSATSADSVKLLNAGTEPRQALRLKPSPGSKETTHMTITMKMDMGLGKPIAVPPMLMTAETTVKNITSAGEINYEMLFTDVSLKEDPNTPAEVAQAMSKSIKNMIGMTVVGSMTDRGISKTPQIKFATEVDPQSRQQMEQMKDSMGNVSTPFPAEPIGIGAKWEYKMPVKSQGLTINQTATYELLALTGKEARIGFTISQSGGKQPLQNPAMAGMKAEMTKMSGSGSGETTFNLEKAVATRSTIRSQSEVSMKMNQGGKEMPPMTMKTEMNLELNSK